MTKCIAEPAGQTSNERNRSKKFIRATPRCLSICSARSSSNIDISYVCLSVCHEARAQPTSRLDSRRTMMVPIGRRWSEQGHQKHLIQIFRYGT